MTMDEHQKAAEQKIIDKIDYWMQIYQIAEDNSGVQQLALRIRKKWEEKLEGLRSGESGQADQE